MSALPHMPAVDVEPLADGVMVHFHCKDFDEVTTVGLTDNLSELAHEQGRPSMYLDLGDVEYLSSATMGRLIVLDKKLRDAGGRLHLCNLNPPVYQLFRTARLNCLLDIRPKDSSPV